MLQFLEKLSMFYKSFVKVLKNFTLILLVLILTACEEKSDINTADEVANVEVFILTTYEPNQTRELIGRVEHTGIAPLAFEVSGQLVKIAVRDGKMVKKGELIAELDKEPYKLAVSKARSQYNQLLNDLTRSRTLRNERILPQATYEQLEAQTDIAKSRLLLAERDLRNTQLLAPFDGRISSRQVELWQSVQAGTPAFNLENSHQADISVDIPQSMIHTIRLNSDLKAIAWLPERPNIQFNLQYKEHSTQGTAGAGIFRLIFTTETPDEMDVLAGMSVRVRLITVVNNTVYDTRSLWRLPVSALAINSEGKYFIWRLDEKTQTAQRVDIEIKEIQQDDVIVIAKDLFVGQRIVNTGQHFIHEGQKLNLIGTSQ